MDKRKEILRSKRVCRFCLKNDEPLTSIYDRSIRAKNSVPLALQIMACVAIEVFPTDGMPSTICQVCRYFMDQSYRFKQICRQGDEALRNFLVHGELRPPIPWPQEMIKSVPEEVLSSTSIEIALDEQVSEGEEEIDVPFDIAEIVKVNQNQKQKKKIRPLDAEHQEQLKVEDDESSMTISVFEDFQESDVINIEYEKKKRDANEGDESKQAFPCTQCHHSFPLKQLLELHMKNHRKKRSHKCPQCGKSFFSKYDLQHHLRVHTGEKPHECVVCHRKFSRLTLLRRHEKVHRTVTKYMCGQCDNVFLSTDSLQYHMARKHSVEKPFKCPYCEKCFAFKQGLERHSVAHSTTLPNKCNYCSEAFLAENLLQRHVLLKHAGSRPYLCKFCPKTFLLPHHYTRHLKSKHPQNVPDNLRRKPIQKLSTRTIKSDNEQFKCVQCDVTFDKQDDLIFHSAVHATQDLTCPLCKETFEDVEEVVVHIKSHIEGEQFMCEWCDLVYTSEDKLDEHIDNEHREQLLQDTNEDSYFGEIAYKNEIGENGESVVKVEHVAIDQSVQGQEEEEEVLEEEEEEEEITEEDDEQEQQQQQEEEEANHTEELETSGFQSQDITVNQDGSLVMNWSPVVNTSQPSDYQQMMIVGGGETIVYQFGESQPVKSDDVIVPPVESCVEPQLPDSLQVVCSVSNPSAATPVSGDSPKPTYTELKTVDVYSEDIASLKKISSPPASCAKPTAPVATPKKPVAGESRQNQETSKTSSNKASILQKAEEVKLQKMKIEELKQKAREQMMRESQGAVSKNSASKDTKREKENSTSKECGAKQHVSPQKPRNKEGESADNQKTEKKYVQKMLSFSKKAANEKQTGKDDSGVKKITSTPSKKISEPAKLQQQKEEPPKPETSNRGREKSLVMLEQDIMELKKNAGLKPGKPSSSQSSTRFLGNKSSINSSHNYKSPPQSKKIDILSKRSPQKVSDKTKSLIWSETVKLESSQDNNLKEYPLQKKKDFTKIKEETKTAQDAAFESVITPTGGSSPRRSRRASKIKDYAAMIRSEVDSDEEEGETDPTSGAEAHTESQEDSDDDIDINEEVLIHRPTPTSKPKVPGRKRGRPKKSQAAVEAKSPPTSTPIGLKRKHPSDEDPQKMIKADTLDFPAKKKRGRPKKITSESTDKESPVIKNYSTPSTSAASTPGRTMIHKLGNIQSAKPQSGTIIMSPSGQPLKQVPAQLIKSLPPGVKPLPLPSNINTLGSPGQVSEIKIGPKTVKVQKILMTKSQLQAMTEKGLVTMKDGAMVLKQGVKLPTNMETVKKSVPESQPPPDATKNIAPESSQGTDKQVATQSTTETESNENTANESS